MDAGILPRERNEGRSRYDRRAIIDEVRRLSKVNDGGNVLLLAIQWLVGVGAGAVAIAVDHWWVYIAAGLVIGTRLQCLAIMMHDACHHTLFSNRRANDLIADLFVAHPLGIGIDLYRASHMRHHRFTNTADDYDYRFQITDPDQSFPKTVAGMLWLLVKSLTGINAPRMLWFARVWMPIANLHNPAHLDIHYGLLPRLRYLLWATIVYGAILISPWKWEIFGLYLIPLFIWSNLFNRMRAMAEHNGVANIRELDGTRTVIPSFIDRLLIVPFNVSYHLEHHLFPSVPGPNLRRLHKKLREDEHFRNEAHVTYGYWGVIKELLAAPSVVSTSLPTVRPD